MLRGIFPTKPEQTSPSFPVNRGMSVFESSYSPKRSGFSLSYRVWYRTRLDRDVSCVYHIQIFPATWHILLKL